MELVVTYVALFAVIVIVGQLFDKLTVPLSLLLVITGMLLSLIPMLPPINLNPEIVLNIFLPLLIYQISAFSSWIDVKKNIRPIALLSVGHVIFITFLVAIVIHTLIPQLGWPLAFVLGAVISPPDDVAIVSIAEKIRMPSRLITILEGEGMFNDATALILFRLALAAIITHEFSAVHAISAFFAVVVGETLYGLFIAYVMGEIRLRIQNPLLHIMASLLTPFLAYLPAIMLGGSGVLATVVAGFVISNRYALHFTPEFRLVSRAVWPMLAFAIQSLIFLLVGLDMRFILESISSIPLDLIYLYSIAIILTIIIGRFIWVYVFLIYLPRLLFPSILKKDPYPPWQYPFIISWAGMRGGISLAAALAVPVLPMMISGVDTNHLLIFLVFNVIIATLILQGLALPWLLKILGVHKQGQREKYDDHLVELHVRLKMIHAVRKWLLRYKQEVKDDPALLDEIKLYLREYSMQKKQLTERIGNHSSNLVHDENLEAKKEIFVLSQITEIEKAELIKIWRSGKISLAVRDKLMERLDHKAKNLG